ncbi:hypothetical protein BJ912DRAFT_1061582 [Pholiota molesta]|nr:hypothetical protein BJ912DRAFT_1061582 [Pholiota molesta]
MCCLSPPGPGPVVVKYQRELPNALSHCGINGCTFEFRGFHIQKTHLGTVHGFHGLVVKVRLFPPMLTHPDATPSPAATPSPDPAPAAPAATPEPAPAPAPPGLSRQGSVPRIHPGPHPYARVGPPSRSSSLTLVGAPEGRSSSLTPVDAPEGPPPSSPQAVPLVPQVSTASEHGGLSQPDPILSPLTTHHSLFSDVEEDGPDTVGSPGFEPHPDLASSIPTGLVEPHPDLASSVPTELVPEETIETLMARASLTIIALPQLRISPIPQFLACVECEVGISPLTVTDHPQKKHHIPLTAHAARELKAFVQGLALAQDSSAVPVPPPKQAPIPGLASRDGSQPLCVGAYDPVSSGAQDEVGH